MCPACVNVNEPLRIIYYNIKGENLLENDSLIIEEILFLENKSEIEFFVKDFVVYNKTEKTHVEISNFDLHTPCKSDECKILVRFKNGETDTVIYQIEELSSRCCTSYSDIKFFYYGTDYLGRQENTIGAYEVIK